MKKIKDNRVIYGKKCNYFCDFADLVDNKSSEHYLLLPNIFIWDPINDEGIDSSFTCPHCSMDSSSSILTTTNEWETGKSNALVPRTPWDQGWVCLIVGRIYSCAAQHKIFSYHADILNQTDSVFLPFILSHRSGMMKSVFNDIILLMQNGMNLLAIETVLKGNFVDNFMQQKLRYSTGTFPKINERFPVTCPSNDTIKSCLISFYKANSRRFCHDLSTINIRNIPCDHTFKCAANIDKKEGWKWIKLFDSIFTVISEEGLVKDYKLTRGTGFEQVRDTLQNIAKDCIDIDNIYIDNCCHWRQLLKDIFPKLN